jgi:hypothetical protein
MGDENLDSAPLLASRQIDRDPNNGELSFDQKMTMDSYHLHEQATMELNAQNADRRND